MKLGDTILWKGKPAKIFGIGKRDEEVFQYSLIMLNKRRFPAILNVSPKSKHLSKHLSEDLGECYECGNPATCLCCECEVPLCDECEQDGLCPVCLSNQPIDACFNPHPAQRPGAT